MRLAILMTNTDESAFAQAHPRDGQKFTELVWRSRPDWTFEVFSVKDGVFPKSLDFDGLLITGSPASVHDDAEWITTLKTLIRDAVEKKLPMFGACFGHQIIARALGADVVCNQDGWVLGQLETQFVPDGPRVSFYAAHKEQVVNLPQNARIVAQSSGCEIAGFAIGNHVLTTQYHPEMTAPFVTALLKAFSDGIGHDITTKAAVSVDGSPDCDALSEWIVQFFETAHLERKRNFRHI